jgi:phosphatidylinositol-4,5-bisphosphate 3-kinase
MENPMFRNRLSAILVQIFAMSGPSFIEYIEKMLIKNEEYKTVSRTVKKKYGSLSSEQVERTAIKMIETWVKEDNLNFCLPIHPTYFVAGYELQKIKVFDSKMVPIKIPLRSSDGAVTSVIFKIGDDLRQDVLILQMFNVMDKMWLENELDLKISTYNVCPIELKSGFVEFVNANVLEGIQKKEGLLSGSMNKGTLYRYLMESSRGNEVDNFIRSLAGYCVATGLLGIGDRHSANVMVKRNGQFLHIDFGHIFGNFKKKFGFKRERSRFLLTPDMANVYITSNNEKQFNHYCVKAYNILRHNGQRLLNLLITMSSAGMPEFSTMADLKYFKHMLQLNKNDQDAGDYFINLIYESVNEKYRIFDNIIHNCAHK